MKVVICSLNSQYVHSSLAPWYLKAGVQAYGTRSVEVEVLEGTVNQPEEVLLERLLETQADVLAFCCYIWNIALVESLSQKLHILRPNTVLILGGPEVSFRGGQVLREMPWISFVNCGEGERPFALLLDALERVGLTKLRAPAGGADTMNAGEICMPIPNSQKSWDAVMKDPGLTAALDGIPGLCRRVLGEEGDGILESAPYYTMEEPPSPYSEEYLERLQGRIAYLETSRGCPFSCAFCLSGRRDPVRFFDLDRAKREMLLLANSGARTVKLVDRTFNCDCKRAYALLEFLIDHAGREIPQGVCFHFEVAADLLDDATLRLLAAAPAGMIQMEAGLQSFHGPTLEAVNRKTDLDRLCRNLRKLLAPGNIHVHIDLIAGLPYEDLATFQSSFDKAYTLRPHMLQLGFLKLLHGSRLREQTAKYETVFEEKPPYTFLSGRWLGAREVRELHALEEALDRLYNSGRFLWTLDYLLSVTRFSPFRLFWALGQELKGLEGVSLESYTARLLEAGPRLPGVEVLVLRDVMAVDLLSVNRSGRLPACLQREDKRLKGITRRLAQISSHREKGLKRAAVLLYSQKERLLVVEYDKADPITGRYPLLELREGRLIPLPDGDPLF